MSSEDVVLDVPLSEDAFLFLLAFDDERWTLVSFCIVFIWKSYPVLGLEV